MIQHTGGPWEWFVDGSGRIYLGTPDRGRLIVMDWVRHGMNSAMPRFAEWKGDVRESMGGLMRKANEIDLESHPDAMLIRAAPDLLAVCESLLLATKEPELQSGSFDEEPSYATSEDHEIARVRFEARAAIARAKGR